MDPILYWNDVALQANLVSHTNGKKEQTGPVLSARALAIVHLAMYDAFARVAPDPVKLPPYLPGLTAPAGASIDAAVAAAAHTTLVRLFPSQEEYFALKLVEAALPPTGREAGLSFGTAVADAILADRQGDPTATDAGFVVPSKQGGHRPAPDSPGQGHYAPFFGDRSKCFAVTAPHTLDPPPPLSSKEYLDAVREVKDKGAALGTTSVTATDPRTSEETLIGLYWAYDGAHGVGTPPRLYNQIVRVVATHRTPANTPAQNARLFALVNVAMADAGILSWREKYRHNLWRPILGVREHDRSMGPAGVGQPAFDGDSDCTWLPLGAPNTNVLGRNGTPPFPSYPSGHATFGAAAFQITRLFYDGPVAEQRKPDTLFKNLTFVSDELDGVNTDNTGVIRPRHVRRFDGGLWEMIEENGRSRVYLGVHFVFDAFAVRSNGKLDLSKNQGGVPLGLKIAEDIFRTGMKKSTVGPAA